MITFNPPGSFQTPNKLYNATALFVKLFIMGWFTESFISFILANNGLEVLRPSAWRIPCLRGGSLTPGRDLQSGAMMSAQLYAMSIIHAVRVALGKCCASNAGPMRNGVTHGSSPHIFLRVKCFSPGINRSCARIQQCPKIKPMLARLFGTAFS